MYFKFLDPTGCTYYNGEAFQYNLPKPGQKFSEPTMHPAPCEPDGEPCGPGRIHLMLWLDAAHAPPNWWPWAAYPVGEEIGRNYRKAAFPGCRLRYISPQVLARMLRPPFNLGRGAYLPGLSLPNANLRGADLSGIELSRADLHKADLSGANLSHAGMYGVNLRGVNLSGACLHGAYLSGSDLSGANLSGADLTGANLDRVYWFKANLDDIICDFTTLWRADRDINFMS